jgi:hypothetical protein
MSRKPKLLKSATPEDTDRSTFTNLEQLPNVGPAVAGYLRRAGIARPVDLIGRDPYAMFDGLCRSMGQRLDPCLLDTFIAAVQFMGGAPAKPWSFYSAQRKRELLARRRQDQGEA